MSRLARSCRDWYQLLDVCALFDTLIADLDGVYDPSQYNDRLLLGLKGTMSEAELHILKQRMLQGKLNKACKGELMFNLPIGSTQSVCGSTSSCISSFWTWVWHSKKPMPTKRCEPLSPERWDRNSMSSCRLLGLTQTVNAWPSVFSSTPMSCWSGSPIQRSVLTTTKPREHSDRQSSQARLRSEVAPRPGHALTIHHPDMAKARYRLLPRG